MTIKQVGNEEKLRDKNIDQTQTWVEFKILHFRTVMEKAKNGIKIDLICVMVQSSSRNKKLDPRISKLFGRIAKVTLRHISIV